MKNLINALEGLFINTDLRGWCHMKRNFIPNIPCSYSRLPRTTPLGPTAPGGHGGKIA